MYLTAFSIASSINVAKSIATIGLNGIGTGILLITNSIAVRFFVCPELVFNAFSA